MKSRLVVHLDFMQSVLHFLSNNRIFFFENSSVQQFLIFRA